MSPIRALLAVVALLSVSTSGANTGQECTATCLRSAGDRVGCSASPDPIACVCESERVFQSAFKALEMCNMDMKCGFSFDADILHKQLCQERSLSGVDTLATTATSEVLLPVDFDDGEPASVVRRNDHNILHSEITAAPNPLAVDEGATTTVKVSGTMGYCGPMGIFCAAGKNKPASPAMIDVVSTASTSSIPLAPTTLRTYGQVPSHEAMQPEPRITAETVHAAKRNAEEEGAFGMPPVKMAEGPSNAGSTNQSARSMVMSLAVLFTILLW